MYRSNNLSKKYCNKINCYKYRLNMNFYFQDDIRSVLNTIPFASRSVGLLLCYSVGPFVSYRLLIYICAAVPVIMLVLTLLLPESPYYLIDVGKKEKAFKELSWLRGTSADKINEELNAIQVSNITFQTYNIKNIMKFYLSYYYIYLHELYIISRSICSIFRNTLLV